MEKETTTGTEKSKAFSLRIKGEALKWLLEQIVIDEQRTGVRNMNLTVHRILVEHKGAVGQK